MYVKYLESYGNIKAQVFDTNVNSKRPGGYDSSIENELLPSSSESETLRALVQPEAKTAVEMPATNLPPTKVDPEVRIIEQYLGGGANYSSGYVMGRLSLEQGVSEAPAQLLSSPQRLLPSDKVQAAEERVSGPINEPPTPFVIKSDRVLIREADSQDIKDFVTGLVDDAAKRFELDSSLGLAIIETESSFNPKAVSRDGHKSKGLFQLLDTTGKEVLERSELSRSYDPYDPSLNVELGMRHLKRLIDIFSSDTKLTTKISTYGASDEHSQEKLAIAAFNAGEGRVAWAQKQAHRQGEDPGQFASVKQFLPGSTRNYVDKVVASRQRQKVTEAVG